MQWCPDGYDPWLLGTLSDDSTNPKLGGGSFQVWRVLDMVFGLSAADEKCVHAAASKATAAQLVEGKARLMDA